MNRQVILKALSQEARFLQSEIRIHKKVKGNSWEKATPESPEGQAAFKEFSTARSALKKDRSRLQKINQAIKAVRHLEQ